MEKSAKASSLNSTRNSSLQIYQGSRILTRTVNLFTDCSPPLKHPAWILKVKPNKTKELLTPFYVHDHSS